MAPVKRRPPARSHHKSKPRRRKPNIAELVYKFLSLGNKEDRGSARHTCNAKCSFCKRQKRRGEVLNSLDSRSTYGRNMVSTRKDSGRNSKIHRARRRQTFKSPTLSACGRKCSESEGLKKMKKYIQKALDFGVESGYLIPKDAAYKVLRVSSELMSDDNYAVKARSPDRGASRDRDRSPQRTPIRFEDYEVQDAGRRRRRRSRRRRRRSRSASSKRRTRSRRRSSSGNADEIVENEIDYEFSEKHDDKRDNPETADGDEGNERLNQSDGEKTTAKRGEDGTDVSVDEDESDDEEERKRDDTTKS